MTWWQTLQALWDPTRDLIAQASQHAAAVPTHSEKRRYFHLSRRLGSPETGGARQVFKGTGLEFHNLREYQPGDEIRKLDWNVFARTGVPHVKEHLAEKQIQVWFFVDATAPMHFGQCQTKLAYAKRLMLHLGNLALSAGHRVGLILWRGDQTPKVIEPRSSTDHLKWVIQALEKVESEPLQRLVAKDFPVLQPLFQHRSLIFCLSDFLFLEVLPHSAEILSRLSPRHQVYSLLLHEPVEANLVAGHGVLPLKDLSSHSTTWIDLSNRWQRKRYRRNFKKQLVQKAQQLALFSMVHPVKTDVDSVTVISRILKAS